MWPLAGVGGEHELRLPPAVCRLFKSEFGGTGWDRPYTAIYKVSNIYFVILIDYLSALVSAILPHLFIF